MNHAFSDWITKHNIHVFDFQLTSTGLLVSIPILYIVNRLTENMVTRKTELVILFVSAMVISAVFAQLIGIWKGKKPSGPN
jgi:hypothetical protein